MDDTYIDGGEGDDCVILVGSGHRIVIGGPGNDRTIQIPASTSEATVKDIVAHCNDPAYLAALVAKQPKPITWIKMPVNTPQAVTHASAIPGLRVNLDMDTGALALICGVFIMAIVLTARWLR